MIKMCFITDSWGIGLSLISIMQWSLVILYPCHSYHFWLPPDHVSTPEFAWGVNKRHGLGFIKGESTGETEWSCVVFHNGCCLMHSYKVPWDSTFQGQAFFLGPKQMPFEVEWRRANEAPGLWLEFLVSPSLHGTKIPWNRISFHKEF